jgi:S-adenosylmethionine hydrolase
VRVLGVNAEYTFSFVREEAEELRWASVPAGGSQFRSRDLFPEAAGNIVAGSSGALAGEIEPSKIPNVPKDRIAYVDGYGNLKTTTEHSALAAASGTALRIRIGDTEREATASDGSFDVEEGKLAFAPGSSGWAGVSGKEVRWMELFLRGGSAWEAFGRPGVGSRLEITPTP